MASFTLHTVAEGDLRELLPLMRGYAGFYEASPSDVDLLAISRALIAECVESCRQRGAGSLGWQTAKDNHRAQAVYERVGAKREEWLDYSLDVPGA